ncbi:hypothetical protein BSPLISOX_576 [uncultured Gammaproteobacteria bacterium]|jgi:TPR repeat protein|nr:hypothetical protein [uncultured Gammaproteobacteria bacterium]VVH65759.1 hypothetical protein BSPLISOX_576 [uncultured Gammaproteobacteria bacterium]
MKYIFTIITLIIITGCIPNTRYSITDDYIIGLRWFERGIQRNRMDNIVIAMDYWKPLLKKADCDAQYRVGLVYFMGIDKPHDFKDAYKLWLKAAKGNQQRAQWALGDLYFQDEKSVYHHCAKTPDCNIKKDIPEALFWYKLFAKSAKYENEKKYVKNIIQLTEAQLTEKEIKAVEMRVSKWTPTPKDCGARDLW